MPAVCIFTQSMPRKLILLLVAFTLSLGASFSQDDEKKLDIDGKKSLQTGEDAPKLSRKESRQVKSKAKEALSKSSGQSRNDSTRITRGLGMGILDDTTRVIYGPSTTRIFTQDDWFLIKEETFTVRIDSIPPDFFVEIPSGKTTVWQKIFKKRGTGEAGTDEDGAGDSEDGPDAADGKKTARPGLGKPKTGAETDSVKALVADPPATENDSLPQKPTVTDKDGKPQEEDVPPVKPTDEKTGEDVKQEKTAADKKEEKHEEEDRKEEKETEKTPETKPVAEDSTKKETAAGKVPPDKDQKPVEGKEVADPEKEDPDKAADDLKKDGKTLKPGVGALLGKAGRDGLTDTTLVKNPSQDAAADSTATDDEEEEPINWEHITLTRYHSTVLDTGILNFHRYSYVARNENLYQDLGNMGSPLFPVFYEAPKAIGVRYGQDGHMPFTIQPEDVPYYDTRSPLSDWYYVQGGGGRSILNVKFNQNINPRLNLGFEYHRQSARKMLGYRPRSRNEIQTNHQGALIHGNYKTFDGRYKVMGHFYTFNHKFEESGGLQLDTLVSDTVGINDLFQREQRPRWRNNLPQNAVTVSVFSRLYVFQEFKVFKDQNFLQAYHVYQRVGRKYTYDDPGGIGRLPNNRDPFYPVVSQTVTPLTHQTRYQEITNELGAKGRLGNLFYSAFLKDGRFRHQYVSQPEELFPLGIAPQQSAGFRTKLEVLKKSAFWFAELDVQGEKLLSGEDYRLEGHFNSRFLEGRMRLVSYQPSRFETFYYSSGYRWDNQFENTQSQEVMVRLKAGLGKLNVRPFVKAVNISNLVYYDTLGAPAQQNATTGYLQAGVDFDIKTGTFRHVGKGLFTQLQGDSYPLRMPELFANYQVFFERDLFKEAIFVQIGFDVHWRSLYKAHYYMPLTQQYHLQDTHEIGEYPMADFFVNFRMSRVRFFFKFNNLFQDVFETGGYLTPGYMIPLREVEFGVRWQLFD